MTIFSVFRFVADENGYGTIKFSSLKRSLCDVFGHFVITDFSCSSIGDKPNFANNSSHNIWEEVFCTFNDENRTSTMFKSLGVFLVAFGKMNPKHTLPYLWLFFFQLI